MRISKLELNGFKSFPDRTAFLFGSGVSCVVGPNGCGKSNVVDALRWCIGEQSARKLRGGEMLDVIFAGSSERPPVGFAEVQLTLTAESGEPFPGEYAHLEAVQVGRRLHRNGTSEYMINQVKVRRRDIVELFLDTGIGNNLYSFIEQGQVDKMVHASPMERRGIIDEAAGIARYAARRSEAQSRLEATASQLDRAADVADEMGRRLRVLERQVLKAARFRRLRALIRQDEILLSLVKYAELSADRRAIRGKLRESEGESAAVRREVSRRQTDLASRREEIAVVDAAAASWRDEVAELDARRRELEGTAMFQKKRAVELGEQRDRAEAEAIAASADAVREDETAAESSALAIEIDGELASVRAALDDAREMMKTSRVVKAAARDRLRAHEEASSAASTELASWRLELERDESRLAELPVLLTANRQTLGDVQNRESRQIARRDAASRSVDEFEVRRGELATVLQQATTAVDEAARVVQEAHERARIEEADLERVRANLEDQVEALVADAGASRDEAEAHRVEVHASAAARLEASRQSGADRLEREFAARSDALQSLEDERSELAAANRHRAISEVESVVRAESAVRVSALEAKLVVAEEHVERLENSLDVQRSKSRTLEEERARLDGEVAAHSAWESADSDRVAAASIVSDVLADSRSLADRLELDAAGIAELMPVLGDRLLLPLASQSELTSLSTALGERTAAALWLPEGDPLATLRSRISTFEDLASALSHHAETGGAAAVRQTGERIGSDGVVNLGRPAASASDALERHRTAAAAEARLAVLVVEIEEAVAATATAEANVADAREAIDTNRNAIREAEAAGRSDEAARVDEARTIAAATEAAAVVAYRAARDGLAAERADAQAHLRAAWDDASEPRGIVGEVIADYRLVRAALDAEKAAASGAVADAETAVRAARSEAREAIRARVVDLRRALESAREAHFVASEGHSSSVVARSEAERKMGAADLELTRVGLDRESAMTLAVELHSRVEELEMRRDELEGERSTLSDGLPNRRDRIATAMAGEEVRQAELEARRTADDEAGQGELQAAESVSKNEIALAGLVERRASAAKLVEDAGARASAARERSARSTELMASLAAAIDEARTLGAAAASELEAQAETRGAAWDRLQRERERLTALRTGLRESEEALRELDVRREALTAKTTELEQKSQHVRMEVEVLRRRIDERYQVSLAGLLDRVIAGSVTLMPDESVRSGFEVAGKTVEPVQSVVLSRSRINDEEVIRTAVADIETHRSALASLGEVNLGALDEYEDLARRHHELDEQRSDLESSVSTIRSAIAKMNRTCRQRFRDAFDRVNENFQVAYPRLVGGGTARLSLTDEDDLLETGVEIFVQPPGKRLQNLTLLSGGEKAMTAIALLIALFRVKPSPFCVLDEVDAPLDEANGARFNDMLREMASLSQFVVITHNRKTMEVADTLYGVTMAKPGVSRLVSVKLPSTG